MPAGRLLRLLMCRCSVVRPVSSSKTSADRLLRRLEYSASVVRLVSSSKMPAGRVLRLLLLTFSVVKLTRSPKSPELNVVRELWLTTDKVVIPARSVRVMAPQDDLPVTASTIASRTSVVRLQTGVTGTVTDTLLTLTLS